MTLIEGVTVLALILGPILAIQISSILERRRKDLERKERVFKVLMATRATPLSPQHVEALNVIDVVFYSEGDKDEKARDVRDSWKVYLDHLYSYPPDPAQTHLVATWEEKKKDLLAKLLGSMAKYFGYKYDEVLIRKAAYYPKAHETYELEQMVIRRKLVEILMGTESFPIKLTGVPPSEEAQKLNDLMIKIYSGETPLKVELKETGITEPTSRG